MIDEEVLICGRIDGIQRCFGCIQVCAHNIKVLLLDSLGILEDANEAGHQTRV